MRSMALKINHLLEALEEEDYDKVISYIEFLVSVRKREKKGRKHYQKTKKPWSLLLHP